MATGSPYLVSPERATKDDGEPYQVFTPFLRKWRDVGWRKPAQSGAESARWLEPPNVVGQCKIPDPGVGLDLDAGEAAALSQWQRFAGDGLDRYAEHRNRPDLSGTSRMSAHLKFGTIHLRTMLASMNLRTTGAQTYLRELTFRDFYAAMLHHWPASVWRNWNSAFDDIETDTGPDARRRFEAWKAGETGFPIVDAGMRQLRQTGFVHNRVRIIVASFLVKDLHLPWQWGAGCGTDAAPYFRVFNPTTQGVKFDPAGDYIRRWVPELSGADDVHLRKGERPQGYPAPIVDHGAERAEALRRYRGIGS